MFLTWGSCDYEDVFCGLLAVTPCSLVSGHQRSSTTMVRTYKTTRCQKSEDHNWQNKLLPALHRMREITWKKDGFYFNTREEICTKKDLSMSVFRSVQTAEEILSLLFWCFEFWQSSLFNFGCLLEFIGIFSFSFKSCQFLFWLFPFASVFLVPFTYFILQSTHEHTRHSKKGITLE
jgi:hypothetical protein